MNLHMNYASEEEIPSSYRELYSRSESGVWCLTGVENLPSPEENSRLKAELEQSRSALQRSERLVRRFGKNEEEAEAFAAAHEQMKTELEQARSKIREYTGKLRSDAIDRALREAASVRGIRPEAVRDVLARASLFTVNEEGKVVTEEKGEEVSAWMDEQLQLSPHWLPASRSAGAHSPSGNAFPGKRTTLSDLIHETWNLTTRR